MEKAKNEFLITFNKPYTFENREYNEIDLSEIENLTTKDLSNADKMFVSTGQVAVMNEMSTGYACIIASLAAHKPVEFFANLPIKEGMKVKTVIVNFLFN